jgi:WD40 repeat protein
MKKRIRFVITVAWVTGLQLAFATLSAAQDKSQEAAVNYDEHVRPILREHCFTCHNQNDAKSGLALDSYASLIEGGSSGEVVFEDDLDSSRLWTLVSHQEEPVMPPGQDKLADAKLDVIRKWIELGMPQNSGSKMKTKKKSLSLAIQPVTGKPEGPAAMPEGLSRDVVVYTERPAAVSAIAASPWAPLVAIAGQQQVLLYHSDSGQLLGVLPFPEGIAYTLRFSRDGSKLLVGGGRGGYAGCAALYDVRTGERLVKVGDELDAVLAADVNPELTRVALGGPGRVVRIFSTETGEMLHEINKHTDWIYAVRYSPDGVLLATADRSNGLFVWEADTAREYLDLRGHGAAVTDVAWRDDSNVLASSSLDGTVRLWEMNDGKQIGRANAHGGGVQAIGFAHDGRVVSAGRDRTAKLWDAGLKPLKTFPAFAEASLKVAITHDGKRVVAGDWAGQIRMWEAADAKPVAELASNPPTLAMRIAELQQQLKAANEVAATSAAELQSLQQRATKTKSELSAAVDSAKMKVAQATNSVAQAEAAQQTDQSQVTNSASAVEQAQANVVEAQKALEAAKARLESAQTALVQAQQREAASKRKLPLVQQQLQKAQADLTKAQENATKSIASVDKQLAEKQMAADAARSEVERLQSALQQLETPR